MTNFDIIMFQKIFFWNYFGSNFCDNFIHILFQKKIRNIFVTNYRFFLIFVTNRFLVVLHTIFYFWAVLPQRKNLFWIMKFWHSAYGWTNEYLTPQWGLTINWKSILWRRTTNKTNKKQMQWGQGEWSELTRFHKNTFLARKIFQKKTVKKSIFL